MLTIRAADNAHHLNIKLIRSEGHVINFLDLICKQANTDIGGSISLLYKLQRLADSN